MTRRKLRKYQSKACWFLYEKKRGALYAGLGSGKTAVMLNVLNRLLLKHDIFNALVVAPVAVARTVWHREAQEWENLRHLKFSIVVGSPKQRLKALAQPADIYVINYENLTWLLNETDFTADAFVLDESPMVKSWSSIRFKGKVIKDPNTGRVIRRLIGLRTACTKFEYLYEISGTPKAGEYLGLWSQIFCIDQGARLGKTVTEFKSKYYYQYGPEHYQLRIRNKQAEQDIQQRLADICYRVSDEEVEAVLPKIHKLDHFVELPRKVRSVYEELEHDFILELGNFEQAFDLDLPDEDAVVEAPNSATLSSKLLQLCNGFLYEKRGKINVAHRFHDIKIEMLDALVEDLNGEPVLIIYSFREDLARLQRWHKDGLVLKSGAGLLKACDAWNANKYLYAFGHPKGMGHGINLHLGGAHHIVWYGLTWSLDYYDQAVGRLARGGQRHGTVFSHHIVAENTVEDLLLMPRLRDRDGSQRQFLAGLLKLRQKHL